MRKNNLIFLLSFFLISCQEVFKKDSNTESKLIRIVYNSDGSYLINDTVDFNDNIAEIGAFSIGTTSASYYTQLSSSLKKNLYIETLKPIQKGNYAAKSSTTSISSSPVLSFNQVYINLFSPSIISENSSYVVATNGTLNITKAEIGEGAYGAELFFVSGSWEGTVFYNNLSVKRNAVLKLINVGFVE
jgi:hypothetical protein